MTGYHSNLALHISEATLKGHRRLASAPRVHWGHVICGVLGAVAAWLVALALL